MTLEIVRYFCTLIITEQFDQKLSETTCVSFWNHVWILLFGDTDVIFDIGELASAATKADMQSIEILFGSLSQTGGRKADTLVRVRQVTAEVTNLLECAVNEHKPMHVSPEVLSHQTSKLLRINRSILGHTASKKTIVFIDAHGMTGTVHGMKAFGDVFGTQQLGTIALPTNKYELYDFLHGDSLRILLRYMRHICRFANALLGQKALERRLTTPTPRSQPSPTFHTPSKKRTFSQLIV
ncbi:hypothetical protein BGZ94_009173 [Podila epigama]|nr:hypothetical protein BGZ94_009173 [Podila epigama]